MIELQGLPAPFLLSWLPFWMFCAFGGFASAFIMIGDIDKRLRHTTMTAITLCYQSCVMTPWRISRVAKVCTLPKHSLTI